MRSPPAPRPGGARRLREPVLEASVKILKESLMCQRGNSWKTTEGGSNLGWQTAKQQQGVVLSRLYPSSCSQYRQRGGFGSQHRHTVPCRTSGRHAGFLRQRLRLFCFEVSSIFLSNWNNDSTAAEENSTQKDDFLRDC
ncbi:hypothetical protein AV530_001693 [Patagioenas fasciata monilis]|uniref:Uncharacterized protein n=1 Tax=Patagioenas fasciata monilis TaxID=372326 RepID=A0A1V4KM24_PATFA|nr:hypothetical protein AV530_001693 [Patagioenas fasciata monilis]